MKNIFPITTMIFALLASSLIQAKEVTFTTKLKDHGTHNAYLAMYLTSADGSYKQTLWVSGQMQQKYRLLRGWAQASGLKSSEYDGRTGATALSGQTQELTLDVPDDLIDAGYEIRIDSVVEHSRPVRDEIVVALSSDVAGKSTPGGDYIESFAYSF